MKILDFATLRKANEVRCVQDFKHQLHDWTPDQWTNAIAGETGEACNFAKKLNRHVSGIRGNKAEDGNALMLREKLGKELADIVIYADLTATALGLKLSDLVIDKFNEKSDEIGSDIKL